MSMRVVLPQPLGPIRAVTVPGDTVIEASTTAWTEPKLRRTPLALTAAAACTWVIVMTVTLEDMRQRTARFKG